ncbi:MAG TPA: PadR family transcriptional regulator [Nitrososphaerales archaeon]|nr:PadR family transcriptional regulator [Nitrososphaerales archaeon]
MISETSGRPVRLGYRSTAGRFELTREDLRRGISILGQGADDLATLMAYACDEAGLKTLVLDIGGRVSEKLSGYIDSYELPHFLYDALRIDEEGTAASVHGQLAASAYSCALDLSFEQEGIINAAMQILAAERGVASPAAVSDLMVEKNDKFRGRPADRLISRLASLSSLNMVGETGAVAAMLKGSAVLSFAGAGQPEAVETAAALVIAKLLAILEGGGASESRPDVVIVPQAGRLFRVRPVFRRTERLLASFVSSHLAKVLASESAYGLDEHFEETGFIKVHSSAVWNGGARREEVLLPNMFMVRNHPYGHDVAFIPREFEPRSGPPKGAEPAPPEAESADLISQMLVDIDSYEAPTRQSVVAFLSQAYDQGLVERTLDKLQSEGYVAAVQKDLKSGRPMSVLALTEKGKSLLEVSR